MALKINEETQERIYELACIEDGCETVGGTITFPEKHGRESDEELEVELDALYTHRCEAHREQ